MKQLNNFQFQVTINVTTEQIVKKLANSISTGFLKDFRNVYNIQARLQKLLKI